VVRRVRLEQRTPRAIDESLRCGDIVIGKCRSGAPGWGASGSVSATWCDSIVI
jgi:hypothetical protein